MRAFPAVVVALTAMLAAPVQSAESFSCTGNFTSCLAACTSSGMSRSDCARIIRRTPPPPPTPVPVLPRSRSQYAPVPQDGGTTQRPGPYVNEQ